MSNFSYDEEWPEFTSPDWSDFTIPPIESNFYPEQPYDPPIPTALGFDETSKLSSSLISRPNSADAPEPVVLNSEQPYDPPIPTALGFDETPKPSSSLISRPNSADAPEPAVLNSQSLKRKREPSPRKTNSERDEKTKICNLEMDGTCYRCIAKKSKCKFGIRGEPCDSCRNAQPQEICQKSYFPALDGLIRDGPTRDFAPTLYFRNESKQGSSAWKKIKDGLRSPIHSLEKHIEISQGQGLGILRLRVREFALNALKNHRCSQNHTWLDSKSVKRVYTCPPWAISDVAYAQSQVAGFMGNSMDTYVDKLIGPPAENCSLASQIRKLSFQAALEYDKLHEGSLPGLALKFWQGCRFIEQFWVITGEERLGMSPDVSSSESPYFQKTPMTPIMDFQLDNIIINHQLRSLMREMRKIIKRKVLTNYKPENDFECYLAMFILLDHVEIAFGHDREWARRHGINGFSNKPLIDALNCGAYAILTMFQHFRGGHFGFTADWAEVVKRYHLDDRPDKGSLMAKDYFLKVREILKDRNWRVLESTSCGSPSYWTSQLHSSKFEAIRVQS